jgi:hypothetical protein
MKEFFPGFFVPTAEEFRKLWTDATFAFDASVLLGLYRVTPETQQAFFDVVQKLNGRIFLPHQSALEYLRNRIAVITNRSRANEALKEQANKFASGFDLHQRDYPSSMATDCAEAAKRAAIEISKIVDDTSKGQPDLLQTDTILSKLTTIFSGKTGKPYDHAKFAEICKEGRTRYASKVPPGYKDDNKEEPSKFGDLIIWFQLIDYASSNKTPIIFISGDAKDDWWWKHEGNTIGPRWELGQEMHEKAGVRFHMYTTPRFLDYAQQSLDVKPEPTQKAKTEFEEIEKQDKQAADHSAVQWFNSQPIYNVQLTPAVHTGFGYPETLPWSVNTSNAVQMSTVSPEEVEHKNRLFELLPFNGLVFSSTSGKWNCEIESTPPVGTSDRACYGLQFKRADWLNKTRPLALWVSLNRLKNDVDWIYKKAISNSISKWLDSGLIVGEIDTTSW